MAPLVARDRQIVVLGSPTADGGVVEPVGGQLPVRLDGPDNQPLLPSAAALSAGPSRATVASLIGAVLLGDDGAALQLASLSLTTADAVAKALNRLRVVSSPMLYNESTWDQQRGNTEGIALASAARTATTSSADIVNFNGRGVVAFVNITAASGLGGLQLRFQLKDPISGNYISQNSLPVALTAVGMTMYTVYPGISAGGTQASSALIGRTFRFLVTHGDASSYTYSVGYLVLL